MYYSIGEFSKITNLTPKMLKIYHEMDLLTPAKVDEFSKYRYIIWKLRGLLFSLNSSIFHWLK